MQQREAEPFVGRHLPEGKSFFLDIIWENREGDLYWASCFSGKENPFNWTSSYSGRDILLLDILPQWEGDAF